MLLVFELTSNPPPRLDRREIRHAVRVVAAVEVILVTHAQVAVELDARHPVGERVRLRPVLGLRLRDHFLLHLIADLVAHELRHVRHRDVARLRRRIDHTARHDRRTDARADRACTASVRASLISSFAFCCVSTPRFTSRLIRLITTPRSARLSPTPPRLERLPVRRGRAGQPERQHRRADARQARGQRAVAGTPPRPFIFPIIEVLRTIFVSFPAASVQRRRPMILSS